LVYSEPQEAVKVSRPSKVAFLFPLLVWAFADSPGLALVALLLISAAFLLARASV
jgi:hypothetical protein